MSTTKSWQTKEWKENRKKKLGDKCEWCGSSEELKLLPHHTINTKIKSFEKFREKVVKAICDEMGVNVQPSAIYSSSTGFNTTKGRVKKKEYFEWIKTHPEQIDKFKQEAKEDVSKWYKSLEDTITVCKKCHFLYEIKHKKLCQTCKKKYHNIKYRECWDCHKKEEAEIQDALNDIEEEDGLFELGQDKKFEQEPHYDLEWEDGGVTGVPKSLIEVWIELRGKPKQITCDI